MINGEIQMLLHTEPRITNCFYPKIEPTNGAFHIKSTSEKAWPLQIFLKILWEEVYTKITPNLTFWLSGTICLRVRDIWKWPISRFLGWRPSTKQSIARDLFNLQQYNLHILKAEEFLYLLDILNIHISLLQPRRPLSVTFDLIFLKERHLQNC